MRHSALVLLLVVMLVVMLPVVVMLGLLVAGCSCAAGNAVGILYYLYSAGRVELPGMGIMPVWE